LGWGISKNMKQPECEILGLQITFNIKKKHLLNHTSNNCIVTQAFLSELQHNDKPFLFFSFEA
jgi:hypothetical protein